MNRSAVTLPAAPLERRNDRCMDSSPGGCMCKGLHTSHTALLKTLQLLCCPTEESAPHRLICL